MIVLYPKQHYKDCHYNAALLYSVVEDNMKYMSILAERICKVLNDHGVCMNGGSCALTRPLTERSPYQLCTCPQGYGGLFCEKKPIPGL